jgi:hypothetical protein
VRPKARQGDEEDYSSAFFRRPAQGLPIGPCGMMETPHGEHRREIDNGGETAEHCRRSFDLLIVVRWLGRPLARACDRLKTMHSSLRFEGRCLVFRFAASLEHGFLSDSTHCIHSCRLDISACKNKVSSLLCNEKLGIAWLSLACNGGVRIVTTLLTSSSRRHDVGRKTRLVAGVPRRWTRRCTTSGNWRDA